MCVSLKVWIEGINYYCALGSASLRDRWVFMRVCVCLCRVYNNILANEYNTCVRGSRQTSQPVSTTRATHNNSRWRVCAHVRIQWGGRKMKRATWMSVCMCFLCLCMGYLRLRMHVLACMHSGQSTVVSERDRRAYDAEWSWAVEAKTWPFRYRAGTI